MKKEIKCYDKFNQRLNEGDYVDVQKDGVHQIYKKEDNQLYFKPYGEEDMVSSYFSNDMAKCDIDGNWINNDRYEDIEEDDEESKQETLEEAFQRIYNSIDYTEMDFASFKLGANWKAENSYSEEELRKLCSKAWLKEPNTLNMLEEFDKWFNQNKKK